MSNGTLAQSDNPLADLKSKYEIVLSSCRLVTEAQGVLDRTIKDFCAAAEKIDPTLVAASEPTVSSPRAARPKQTASVIAKAAAASAAAARKSTDNDSDSDASPAVAEKVPAEKKVRKERDPNMPKRPASAFLAFQSDVRAQMKGEMSPETESKDVQRAIAVKWNEMDDEARKPYKAAYDDKVKEYEAQMALYNQKNGIVPPAPKAAPAAKKPKKAAKEAAAAPAASADDDDAAAASLVAPPEAASPKTPKKRARKADAKETAQKDAQADTASQEKPEKKERKKRKKSEAAAAAPSSP